MPRLHVIVDEKGEVLGTCRVEDKGAGLAPDISLHVQPGQRLVDIDVTESTVALETEELHKKIKMDHLK